MVVAYAPTDYSSIELKEHFYSDLDHVMANANRLTMVMEDFNATLGESLQGIVGPLHLGKQTSDNGTLCICKSKCPVHLTPSFVTSRPIRLHTHLTQEPHHNSRTTCW